MAENKPLHVVLFPWSAFGHLMPHFQLAIALAKSGVHISFVSTPRNLHRLPGIPPSLSPFITLVPIPLPKLAGDPLPEGAEATVDVPFDKIPFLKLALDLAEPAFREFVANLPNPPDWMIVDFNATWICEISRDFQIPIVFFRVLSPGFLGFFAHVLGSGLPLSEIGSLMSPPPIDGSMVAFRRHEAAEIHADFFEKNNSGMSDGDRVKKIISASRVIAVRSCYEFDEDYLKLYTNYCGKKVIPLGLLPPERPQKTAFDSMNSPWKSTFDWLDRQDPKSVLFVGFGSECKLTKDQIHEIARGVELSELPFLWSLRKPAENENLDVLPAGFRDRTAERGIVSMGWAPQMEILGNPAIGGSLFHGGWGSAIEALQFGHCLILLPFIIDQPLNARLLVEKGYAIEVERNEDGSFSGEDIAKALKEAMVLEEGEKIRKRAREAAAIFGDTKLHQRYIEEFVQFLRNEGSNE